MEQGDKFKYEYEGKTELFMIRNYGQLDDGSGTLPAPSEGEYFSSYGAYLMIRDEWHENNTYRQEDFVSDKPFLSYAYYNGERYEVNYSNEERPDENHQSEGDPWIKIVED